MSGQANELREPSHLGARHSSAERRDSIVAPSFVVSRGASLGKFGDQTLLHHTRDGTVECARAEAKLAPRSRFDVLDNRVAVPLPVDQRQQEVKRHGREREQLGGVCIRGHTMTIATVRIVSSS